MRKPAAGEYRSAVYTNRPDYADFDAPHKFLAIESIIARRLIEHPNAICSYSAGSDSDIMIDAIERVRKCYSLPPVRYVFFNTGLEMQATKDHVKATAERYGVEIETVRPKIGIVTAVRRYGVPFVSKIMSGGLSEWQKKGIPLDIADEYANAEDKAAKRRELRERYPKCESLINFLCCCNAEGEPRPNIQLVINSSKYMLDFIRENPPKFRISAKCCDWCADVSGKYPANETPAGFWGRHDNCKCSILYESKRHGNRLRKIKVYKKREIWYDRTKRQRRSYHEQRNTGNHAGDSRSAKRKRNSSQAGRNTHNCDISDNM